LQHSSGTTGLQKGVALTHTAVLNQLAAYSQAIALHADDVVVSWLPLYHDMGLIAGFLLPLVQGLPLVLLSPFDWVQHPALLLQAIDRYRGTLCWLPNFAYNHCARRIRRRDKEAVSLASMRLFINCSEPVRHSSHQLFLEAFAAQGVTPDRLGVSYAMAENTFAVTQTRRGSLLPWIGSTGNFWRSKIWPNQSSQRSPKRCRWFRADGRFQERPLPSSMNRASRCRRAGWARLWCAVTVC
jgi:fatty-acyl-CoA synthase